MVVAANNSVLSAEELVGGRGDRLLFKNVNFTLSPGTVLYLKGANGSGKTTLLRMLCGLSQPYAGSIRWHGNAIHDLAEEYRKHVLYVGHLPSIKEDLTAVENLQFFMALSGVKVLVQPIVEVLNLLGLSKGLNLQTRMLSQGQKRRVALARLWLQDLPLWVLDEPFTALDVAAADLLKQKIESFARAGGMVVMTTHQEVLIDAPNFVQVQLGDVSDKLLLEPLTERMA